MSESNKVEELVTEEFVSPYKLSKLESTLRNKRIPPQKLYGYIRNGYLKGSVNSTGKIQISRKEQIRYLNSQVKSK